MKNGKFVKNNVIEIISSDDEKTNTTFVPKNQPKEIHDSKTTV